MRDKKPRDKRAIEDPNRIDDNDPWAPPRTESYRVSGGGFIRYTMFVLVAAAVLGAFAYSQYTTPKAPNNQLAEAQTSSLPPNSPLNYSAPPAPPQEVVPPADAKPAPAAAPRAMPSAPRPAPLAGPSATPMDIDPATAATPTPIPEQAPQ